MKFWGGVWSYIYIPLYIRLSLKHGKDLVWQKNVVVDVGEALFEVLGRSVVFIYIFHCILGCR